MDIGLLIGVVLIVIWGIGAFAFEGPGWIHALLTLGVFLVIWRIVVRGDRRHVGDTKRDTRQRDARREG